jgi:hypothetical protein
MSFLPAALNRLETPKIVLKEVETLAKFAVSEAVVLMGEDTKVCAKVHKQNSQVSEPVDSL